MEQQNQQPNQPLAQTFLDEAKQQKSKRIKITLLALAAVFTVVGGIFLLQRFQEEVPTPQPQTQDIIPPQVRKSFTTQEECELQTGYRCDFVNCDVNCPIGFQKGWSATDIKLKGEEIDTSDWQTYRNEKYRYSIKYPSNWEITSPFTEKTPEAVRFAKLIEREGDAAFDIIVEANPLKKPATKEWYLDWVKNIPAGVDISRYIFETMDFHGHQAVKVNNTELFFAKDIYMFRIGFNVSIYNPDRGFGDFAKTIFDQILSTFRFIE